jgi:two-component system, LytTR family, response regulator AlgR
MDQTRLHILIVDDEYLARERLKLLLEEQSDLIASVTEAEHAPHAMTHLAHQNIDLILLDIQLPGANGLRTMETIRTIHPQTAVVFVTAHSEHAVEAFDLQAIDYITKPVRSDRLRQALMRARQQLSLLKKEDTSARDTETKEEFRASLLIHDRGQMVRVAIADALYFKADSKYVVLKTLHKQYLMEQSLNDIQQIVGAEFVRIHRNALVAKRCIQTLHRRTEHDKEGDTWQVHIHETDEWLSVSRRQLPLVRQLLHDG